MALVASIMMAVAGASSSGIATGAAVLMSTTGLVQGRRGGFLSTTGSFQLSSGGGGAGGGPYTAIGQGGGTGFGGFGRGRI